MLLLITGSTGFVGRNLLLRALREEGITKIILPVRNKNKLLQQIAEEGSQLDCSRLAFCEVDKNQWQLPSSLQPNVAIHCAGLTFSQEREDYFETNVTGTLNLLKKLPETTRLLVLSSQAAGGPTPDKIKARSRENEDAPVSWYGESKLIMEKKLFELVAERLLIVRPPMILGPRDTATIPLFQMAKSPLRMKPGFRNKEYSWIDVNDLCSALLVAAKADWNRLSQRRYALAHHQTITDRELLKTTAKAVGSIGITLPLPHLILQLFSKIVYRIPALHQSCQSLGRDRIKEILHRRWIIDGSDFERDFNYRPRTILLESLKQTAEWIAQQKKRAVIKPCILKKSGF